MHPISLAVRDAAIAAQGAREADLHQMADEAVARATAAKKQKGKQPVPRPVPLTGVDGELVRYPVRAFIHTWGELTEWWTHYDPDQLAAELTDEQIACSTPPKAPAGSPRSCAPPATAGQPTMPPRRGGICAPS